MYTCEGGCEICTTPESYNVEVRFCGHGSCAQTVTFFGGESVCGTLRPHEWATSLCPACGTKHSLTRSELGKALPAPQRAVARA